LKNRLGGQGVLLPKKHELPNIYVTKDFSMIQIYQAANGKYYSRNQTFDHKPFAPVRQPGGKRKAPHRRISYVNIPFLQKEFIICESDLERDCALIISLNPEVTRIEYQPQKFDLGKTGGHIPDFRVSYRSAPQSYIEVKPEVFAYETETWEKICAAHHFFKSQGIVYEYISDRVIQSGNRHHNATYIHRCGKLPIPIEQSQRIIEVANHYPDGIRMEDLQAITGLLTDHILHCVGNRRLTLNEYFEYQLTSMIYPLQGECK
jgi:hypothetical protein